MKKISQTIRKMRKGMLGVFAIVTVCGFMFGSVMVNSVTQKESNTSRAIQVLESTENIYIARAILRDPLLDAAGGNVYSTRMWGSLGEAKAYYGYGFSYGTCNHNHNGIKYNNYYKFSDSSRCYFRVGK